VDVSVAFGRVVRRLRLKAGLSQEQLGYEAELRRTFVSVLELGQQQPTLTTVLKLARALRLSARDLVGLVEAEMASSRKRT
jgi:transcriptional regulator with XRE-family HTH domain